MANRQQRRAKIEKMQQPQMALTPEQQAQVAAEESMEKFIEENGLEAMMEKQREWKLNDIRAKVAAASNIKAWFETAYEVSDMVSKGILDPETMNSDLYGHAAYEYSVNFFNNIKINLYESIEEIYQEIDFDIFGVEPEDFVNPFGALWSEFEQDVREDITMAILELYAWTILEDPVLWSSQMNGLVLQYNKSKFVEEESE